MPKVVSVRTRALTPHARPVKVATAPTPHAPRVKVVTGLPINHVLTVASALPTAVTSPVTPAVTKVVREVRGASTSKTPVLLPANPANWLILSKVATKVAIPV